MPHSRLILAIVWSLAFGTASVTFGQKYSLTPLGHAGGSTTASQRIVYQNQLYYAETYTDGTAAIYRDNGVTSELVRSLTTKNIALGPILDDRLYYRKDNRQYRLDDPLALPLAATDSSINLTSTSYYNSVNGKHLFWGNTSAGTRLYRLDAQGLSLVGDISGTGDDFDTFDSAVFNNQLVMSAKGPLGQELYRTDGNSIQLIADIRPGTIGSNPGSGGYPVGFRQAGSKLYFDAGGPHGSELFAYDGNTVYEVADIRAGTSGSEPTHMVPYKGSLIFSATGASGEELYIADANGAHLLADINTKTATASSFPGWFVEYNDWIYFQAAPDGFTNYLYRTNGVQVQPMGIVDPDLVRLAYDQTQPSIYGGKLYFSANAGIFSTDGTATTVVPGAEGNTGWPPPYFQKFAQDLIISYDKGTGLGTELYRWNGTTFSLLFDIAPGCSVDGGVCYANSSVPNSFVEANGSLYFLATNGTTSMYRLDANATDGDFNFDGKVDSADYALWRKGFPTRYTMAEYDEWRAHFGQIVPIPAAGSNVPESAARVMIALATLAALGLVRHRL